MDEIVKPEEQAEEEFLKKAEQLELKYWPSKILNQKCAPITQFDKELKELAAQMHIKLNQLQGVGLAAPQIGKSIQLLVMNIKDTLTEVCNPKIIDCSNNISTDFEGCLSFPGIVLPVTRPIRVVVEYQDIEGNSKREQFAEVEARIILHEIEHLEGKTFLEKVSKLKKQLIVKKFEKTKKRIKIYEKEFRKAIKSANKKSKI